MCGDLQAWRDQGQIGKRGEEIEGWSEGGRASSAKARRDFCPPERNLIGLRARSPERPKRPKYLRA